MPANIEIKARIEDFEASSALASKIADDPKPTILQQCDTFFHASNGRLKLRQQRHVSLKGDDVEESGLTFAELIAYDRTDGEGPKQSTYSKSKIVGSNAKSLEEVLTVSCGVKGIVTKKRHLFLVDQTRIHLDKVEGLEGAFLELEVVMKEGQTEEEGKKIAEDLMGKLNVVEADLMAGAYLDLLKKL